MSRQWVVIIPVKELHAAKSRLASLGETARADFALAAARDVLAAALGCTHVTAVYVVTNDVRAAETLTRDGARVIADTADSGLNPALSDGARTAGGWHPRAGVVALSSDLPAVSSAELTNALEACEASGAPRCFVPDAAGTGTAMLAARPGTALQPLFGSGSRLAHLGTGAVELAHDWPGLRTDVDTPQDLASIPTGTIGVHTARLLEQLGTAR